MQEEWRGVVGYEDYYEISNKGRLRNTNTKRLRKLFVNKNGYHVCSVSLGSRSIKPCWKIHRLVASAFKENSENKPLVNHVDGNKLNNHVTNLEWVTYSENSKHAVETGLVNIIKGEDHTSSKLTNEIVEFVKDNYKPYSEKFGARAFGRMFNVSHSVISDIINNKTWKHI